MKKKYAAAAILVFCAVLITVSALVLINNRPENPHSESSSSFESESVPTSSEPETKLPLYDGDFISLDNGDSFYTPDKIHSVTDAGRTVLYYNNLLLAFTAGDLPKDERDSLARSIGGEIVGVISGAVHAIQIRVLDSDLAGLEKLAAKLMENESVIYSCAEYPVQIMGTRADENPWASEETEETDDILGDEANPAGNDWWAEAIGAYTAWEYSSLCGEIRVGIADNGFFTGHEDFGENISVITPTETNTPADHGTLVAGIIGAADNNIGIRGIADTAKLYCADLWPEDDPDSYHTMAEYLAVINLMAQSGVKIVNNSWGCLIPSQNKWEENIFGEASGTHGEEYSRWVDNRINRDLIPTAEYCIVLISQLISSGYENILMVQAAGNGLDNGGSGFDARSLGFFAGITEEVYQNMAPSVYEKLKALGITYKDIDERILIVGAVLNERDPEGNFYMIPFSNFGETVDICAPGASIFSTAIDGYGAYSGTSLSAPMVAGGAALIWSLKPELTVSQVRNILLGSARFRAVGFEASECWSYPMLNIGAAAEMLLGKEW
ncbi:MAG: S8 family serine peptidase [Oscillospiraceae bacterium]|nr:S8 family serine peptidase [Oscillospiraceae bacterium]